MSDNTDQYRVFNDEEKAAMLAIKASGQAFLNALATAEVGVSVDPRCAALARTKIEEAVMWAVKGLTS